MVVVAAAAVCHRCRTKGAVYPSSKLRQRHRPVPSVRHGRRRSGGRRGGPHEGPPREGADGHRHPRVFLVATAASPPPQAVQVGGDRRGRRGRQLPCRDLGCRHRRGAVHRVVGGLPAGRRRWRARGRRRSNGGGGSLPPLPYIPAAQPAAAASCGGGTSLSVSQAWRRNRLENLTSLAEPRSRTRPRGRGHRAAGVDEGTQYSDLYVLYVSIS